MSQGGPAGPSLRAILRALETVRDPELDKPITSLGFVASCTVSADGDARVRLRLPTYFCAPNFAFLMVADTYEAVARTPGVRSAAVVLEDHFASDPINAGVAARAGFVASFGGEAAAELDELRAQFLRKAVMAGTDQVCRPLLASGTTPERLRELTLADVPPSRELDRLRQRRAELGLPAGDDAFLLIDPETGAAVTADAVPLHLRRARVTQAGIEANTSMCTGMLAHRYPAANGGLREVRDPGGPGSEGPRAREPMGGSGGVPNDALTESSLSAPRPRASRFRDREEQK